MTAIAVGEAGDGGLTRRAVVAAGGAALAAVALADAGRIAAVATRLVTPGRGAAPTTAAVPAHLRRSTFAGRVGERFELTTAGGRVMARLIAVDPLGMRGVASTAEIREDAFALIFRAPAETRLADAIMTVSHPELGAFPLFVSSFGAGRHGQEYAAIVNRASSR
jgi:uncharacterized protein DUF6916